MVTEVILYKKNTLTDNIVLGAERFNNCLVPVAPEPLNDNLQDNECIPT